MEESSFGLLWYIEWNEVHFAKQKHIQCQNMARGALSHKRERQKRERINFEVYALEPQKYGEHNVAKKLH